MLKDARGPFGAATHGFVELSFTADAATVELADATGPVGHAFTRSPEVRV